jgi:tyrosyl-tRNA synthetase
MTTWVHGDAAVKRVEIANKVFATYTLDGFSADELAALAETIPTVDLPRAEMDSGIGIVDLLARTVADSKGAARRLIQQGGAYVNNVKIGTIEHKVTREHLVAETWLLVRSGKKDLRLVRAV